MSASKCDIRLDPQFQLSIAEQSDTCMCFSGSKYDAACIGHLRGHFEGGSSKLWTSWWPHHEELGRDAFDQEFDALVASLQKSGLLANFSQMQRLCRNHADAQIRSQTYGEEFAFQIDTKEQRYFLRCIPSRGDYNCYLYAYDKERLLEMQRAEHGLPKQCWSTLPSTGELITIVYGESGYHPQDFEKANGMTAKEMAEMLNKNAGVTAAQRKAMEAGSLFGWSVPGAYPKAYEKPTREAKRQDTER